ncbi:MAG TPA: MerR family transcriptional regulator [Solirubrobacterales bacterium]|nr:MerR family transcriptional regulator [Solirubrobacterales bacterium]
MTIEQLAARSGMTVRNIRSHGSRGLLPPPEVRDRIGHYGPEHLNRLRLIQDLQGEGFNLKGIERMLETRLGPAEQMLSFKRDLESFEHQETAQTFTREELAKRFGEESEAAINRAVELGALVPMDDDHYEAPFPSLLDAAEAVLEEGVPLDHTLVVFGKVQSRCRSVAHEFVTLFLKDVWKPFEEEGYPEERWPEVHEALHRLRPLSSQALSAIYQMTMADEVESAFGKKFDRLSRRKH